ncbi:conserved hypothetical protein [Sphingomonas sp. AX6]|nr:conserved hypothetical protein [Sphingomonas sp. AX6]
MRALARRVALAERGEDRDSGIDAGEDVGIGDARFLGRAVGLPGQRHDAAHRLDDEIVPGARCIRPGLPEAGDRGDDQARVEGAEAGGIETVFDEAADLVVFDHHVGFGDQRADFGLALRRGDIDRAARFPAIGRMEIGGVEIVAVRIVEEGRPPVTRVVACAGTFDLDDLGTEIGQELPAPWPGEDAGEFDDLDAGEGFHLIPHPSPQPKCRGPPSGKRRVRCVRGPVDAGTSPA